MRKLNRLAVLGGFVLCFCIALLFSVDTEYCYADSVAPQINSITVENADHLDANGNITVTMDIVEKTPGVTYVSLLFTNDEGHSRELSWQCEGDLGEKPYFTGKITLKFPLDNSFMNGEYRLSQLSISDGDQNKTTYSSEEEIDAAGLTTVITIFNSTTDVTKPVLNSIAIMNTDTVDATGKIKVQIDATDEGSGITFVALGFDNHQGHQNEIQWYPKAFSGTKTLTHDACDFGNGLYYLDYICLADGKGNDIYYYPEDYGNIVITVINSTTDVTPPEINHFSLNTHEITTPDVIAFDLDFTEDTYAVDLGLTFVDEKGHSFYINLNTEEGFRLKAGSYKSLELPIGAFTIPGEYTLTNVFIQDALTYRDYSGEALEELIPSTEDRKLTIHSQFDIFSECTLDNITDALDTINSMGEGQTVLIDSRNEHVAPKELFEAIAGQNKMIVFDDGDIQWVFSGLTVMPEKCKDINVQTLIRTYSGISMGFPDDSTVVGVIFKDNGILPGPVQLRINDNYIKTKFANQASKCFLSYVGSGLPEVVDSNVGIAKDNAAEMTIDHNSTYILSSKKPRAAGLTSASLTKTKYTYIGKALKPGVTAVKAEKKTAASKGYSITYKNNKNVGKASVVIQGKGIYKGKLTKYFTINPKGTTLKTPKKAKKAITVKWSKQATKMSTSRITGYQIQLATNSSFTKNKKTVNVKGYSKVSKKVTKLKGGVKYYVKVRTYKTVGGTVYYSGWSKVKTVKTKK